MSDNAAGRCVTPAVLVFWRTDCVPCRAEFEQLADLCEAAGKMRMLLVSVDDSIADAPPLLRDIADSWYAQDRPARVLGMFGGDPPLVARWVERCMR